MQSVPAIRTAFANDPLEMKLGRLRLVAGKTLPGIHVDDVVLYADIAALLDERAKLKTRVLLAETAVTACHAAMLGKVNAKSDAWTLVFSVQDHPKPNLPA